MKPDDLLDYALGQLEGPAKDAVESSLADDPDLSLKADRLARTLGWMLDDGDEIEPPASLASRTVAFVADRSSKRAAILDFVPARVPFRWADVAVAAGILLAGLLTLLPAMNATRNKVNQAGCAFNLQQLGSSLVNYSIRHNQYPDVISSGTDSPVGQYVVALKDDNLLRDPRSLHCPCKGKCPEMNGLTPEFQHIDYAYNIGYRHEGTHEPEPATPLRGTIPLLADQPLHEGGLILPGNSPNHGFRGQNVLFSDLHIEWFSNRHVKFDRDVFLNDDELPAAGTAHHDAALVPAVFQAH